MEISGQRFRSTIVLAVALGLCLPAGAGAAAADPPRDPAIAQYIEDVPTAEGPTPARSTGSEPAAPANDGSASNGAPSSGGSAGPTPAERVPSGDGSTTPASSESPGAPPGPRSPSLAQPEAAESATEDSGRDSEGGLGQGVLLAIIVGGLAVSAAGAVALRRRLGQ